jgi:signal transduction histidine kinase
MSLRLRLVLAGALAVVLALGLSALGLSALFGAHVERRAIVELSAQLDQLVAGLDRSEGAVVMAAAPAGAGFIRPYSGTYWQIDLPEQVLRSRSLWDVTLTLPELEPTDGRAVYYKLAGPDGQQLLAVARTVVLPRRLGAQEVTAIQALNFEQIVTARRAFVADLLPYLLVLGLVLITAGWIQITVGLQPLARLRQRVSGIRAEADMRMGDDWPTEVKVLATELDALLQARATDLERARLRAADLAHSLKTPLQALMGEAMHLRKGGSDRAAQSIEDVSQAMRRTVDRELNRARRGAPGAAQQSSLVETLAGVISVLKKTPDGQRIDWSVDLPPTLLVPLEASDLAEALGAVLENAARHAATHVDISHTLKSDAVCLSISDDGAGIPRAQQNAMLARFARLDESGSGMGLAIARDIMTAAGGDIKLSDANPSLCVTVHFKTKVHRTAEPSS